MVQLFQWLVLRRYKSAPCAHYNSTLVRHKPFIQWQCSFQMKAVLPLDERFVMALCCFNDKSPPLWCFSKTGPGQPCNSFACTCTHQWTQWETITYRREFPTPAMTLQEGIPTPWHHNRGLQSMTSWGNPHLMTSWRDSHLMTSQEEIPTPWHHKWGSPLHDIRALWHHKRKSPLFHITTGDPNSISWGDSLFMTSQGEIPTPWHHKRGSLLYSIT